MKRTPLNLKSEVRNPKSEILAGTRNFLASVTVGALLVVNAAWGAAYYQTPFTFTTIAGTLKSGVDSDGTNGVATFFSPTGVALDTNGNLYVADADANTIRKVSPSGTNWVVTTIAGNANDQPDHTDGTNSDARFYTPYDVAVDGAGNLYVADYGNQIIRRIVPVGTNWVVTTIAGTANPNNIVGISDGTNGAAQFSFPSGVAVDAATNVYVADTFSGTIRKITPVGTNWVVTTIAGNANISTNATGPVSADGTNLNAVFYEPNAIAIDRFGNLFVADGGNATIREITPVGTNWVTMTIAGTVGVAGADDGTNTSATFTDPFGITVDASDNVYVADSFANNIRKLSQQGTNWVSTTLAGTNGVASFANGAGPDALFSDPWGVAVDAAGNVYVADTSNDLIREGNITPLPFLAINLTATNSVVVSWPGAYGRLQIRPSLVTGGWNYYGGTVAASNGINSAIFTPFRSFFFRLSY